MARRRRLRTLRPLDGSEHPRKGRKEALPRSVRDFRVAEFAAQANEVGARFVIFTISHAEVFLPFPCPELDAIIPGHTCRRDLVAELQAELAKYRIRLMLYFNPEGTWSPDWQELTEFHSNRQKHAEYTYSLVRAISERYGERISGWWIDCCLEPPVGDSGLRYDYVKFADALRAGNPDALVTFNYRGVEEWGSKLGEGIIDYQAGEASDLSRLPHGRFSGECGSQWFTVIPMEDHGIYPTLHNNWVHTRAFTTVPLYPDADVIDFARAVKKGGGVFAYNVGPYMEGLIASTTVAQLRKLKEIYNVQE